MNTSFATAWTLCWWPPPKTFWWYLYPPIAVQPTWIRRSSAAQSCHVMHPEYTAYKISPHSHVACVDSHIGSGAEAYFNAKVDGTKKLIEVSFHPLAHYYPKFIPDYP